MDLYAVCGSIAFGIFLPDQCDHVWFFSPGHLPKVPFPAFVLWHGWADFGVALPSCIRAGPPGAVASLSDSDFAANHSLAVGSIGGPFL